MNCVLKLVLITLALIGSLAKEDLQKPIFVATDRGVNRDFYNIVPQALLEGTVKLSLGGKLDCMQEGLTIGRAVVKMTINAYNSGKEDDLMNVYGAFFDLVRKCDYLATLQAAIIDNMMVNKINDNTDLPDFVKSTVYFLNLLFSILINLADDGYVGMQAY